VLLLSLLFALEESGHHISQEKLLAGLDSWNGGEQGDCFKIMISANWVTDKSYLLDFQRAKAKFVTNLEYLCIIRLSFTLNFLVLLLYHFKFTTLYM
jgi:hypothetical protein